ncbi:MAG TPA: SUMF1/EgtB/PvdO family nonheme iron enzyme [Polyangiaceae bacterium]
MPRSRFWPCLGMASLLVACPKQKRPAPATPSASATSVALASATPRAPARKVPAPIAGERVDIPGGTFIVGSRPGDPGRNPELEPRSVPIELGPYQIDRMPYPNDPALPTQTDVVRDEAKRLCGARGERLCTELEWERACKGPASQDYASGSSWDTACASDAKSCASSFDVLGLGATREWVSSEIPSKDQGSTRALLRGAAADAPDPQHRCAARHTLEATSKAADLGFRCCKGAPNAAIVPEPKPGETFARGKITVGELEKLFGAEPHTAPYATELKFYREPDAANTVVSRGPGDKKGFLFTVAPLTWRPATGAEFLVVTGKSGDSNAFVAVLRVLGDNDYALASSFVMKNEPGPVALAYSDSIKPRLHFSTCWGCPGETGKILFRPPESVVIFQP